VLPRLTQDARASPAAAEEEEAGEGREVLVEGQQTPGAD